MNDTQTYAAVVLGGGIAGISAALELARLGHEVALVEKTPFFGGRAARLACKAIDVCQKCGVCLVEESLRALFQEPRVTLYPHTELVGCRREPGLFHLTLRQQPQVIDAQRCVDCGLCLDECPASAQGAILTTEITQNHPRYAVNPGACLYFRDGSCRVCQRVCPPTAAAVDLERPARNYELTVGAVIVATGYRPADPACRPHYGYGHVPGVISGVELEERLRHGRELTGRPGEAPRRVAFIQCVGSRDLHHPYCSRVCCAYTLRLARLLKHRQPEAELVTFYMDLQNIGRDDAAFRSEAGRDLQVIRALPGDVRAAAGGGVRLRYLDPDTGEPRQAAFDLVVLAVGLGPGADNAALADLLQVGLTADGFLQSADGEGCRTSHPGLFLAGTVAGPRDIAGCITQALAAARQASRHLAERAVKP